jgi:hypothetical protein
MKVKVLIADKFPEQYIDELKALDLDVECSPKLGENALPEAASDVQLKLMLKLLRIVKL